MNKKEIVILCGVISFVVSVSAGFLAGSFGYSFIKGMDDINKAKEEKISYESAVVKVVKEASPAVVSIIVTKDLPVLEKFYEEYNPFGDNEFFRQFFGDDFFPSFQVPRFREKGTEKVEIGGGTGFIISADGLILTNKHVVADAEAEYTVLTNEGEKMPAQVLFRDSNQDIAVLKIDRTGLSVIELGDSDKIEIGQAVVAIGNALGEFRNTVSVGVISGLSRSITALSGSGQTEKLSEVIQTDAAINPGNSGGPLLNLKGQAIGINVAMAQGAENIAFALPINLAREYIEHGSAETKTY